MNLPLSPAVVNGWSMHRYEKLDILIQGSFITGNELNSAPSGSFVSSTGLRHLIGFCRLDSLMKGLR